MECKIHFIRTEWYANFSFWLRVDITDLLRTLLWDAQISTTCGPAVQHNFEHCKLYAIYSE
jgi:hypothetical protein